MAFRVLSNVNGSKLIANGLVGREFWPAASIGQVRWRRVQTRKFKQPNYEKKLMLAVSEPVKKLDRRPSYERCGGIMHRLNLDKWSDPHPWEKIIAEDVRRELESAALIAVFHQNGIKEVDKRDVRNMCFKKGFLLRQCNRMVYYLATQGTRFSAITPLLSEVQNNVIMTSREPNVAELLRLDRKMPDYILLYAIMHNRILRKDELAVVAKMPGLDSQRAQLVGTLDASAQTLHSNIGYHLSQLSHSLDQYAKQQQPKTAEPEPAPIVDDGSAKS